MEIDQKKNLKAYRGALARNIVAARASLGWSQDKLANEAGLSRPTLTQIENASGDPRLSTLVNIGTALSISPMFLLTGPEEVGRLKEFGENYSDAVEKLESEVGSDRLAEIEELLLSGIKTKQNRGAKMAVESAESAGIIGSVASGAAVGGAAGTAVGAMTGTIGIAAMGGAFALPLLVPGILIGAMAGGLFSMGKLSAKIKNHTTKGGKPKTDK